MYETCLHKEVNFQCKSIVIQRLFSTDASFVRRLSVFDFSSLWPDGHVGTELGDSVGDEVVVIVGEVG